MNKKKTFIILGIVIIFTYLIGVAFPPQFEMQYVIDGELKTEVFSSTKEWNMRAEELKEMGIKYYRHFD